MHDYFDLYKKCYNHYYCSCYNYHNKKVKYIFPGNVHKEFCEKIIKLCFNIEYTKIFNLLLKEIKLNKYIYNINVLMNLYDNSNIDCNKKIKINYMIYIIILFLINSFIVIKIKIIFSLISLKEYK